MNFSQKYGPWALIAGASDGTGRSFARQIAAEGVNCILIARREEPLSELAAEIRAGFGVECIYGCVDLAVPGASDELIEVAKGRDVGLLVFNAGSDVEGSRFLKRSVAAWNSLVQRNVMTMMQASHQFAAPMQARGRGGILLVNSGACYGGASFMAAYSASKAFMLAFTEGLWSELHTKGIDVLTLVLGRTATPAFFAVLKQTGQPVPDNVAHPDDVARLGLERLPHGPIQNWGLDDDMAGYAGTSAAARRQRILMVNKMSVQIFGE